MGRKILVTGAGSGLGEGTAIGLARNGHDVIAAAQTWPQVTAIAHQVESAGASDTPRREARPARSLRCRRACKWDFDILVNNAGIGEGGPIAEIPLEIVRHNFEVNVFAPLALTQQVVRKLGRGRDPRERSSSYRRWAGCSVLRGFPPTPRRNTRSRRLRRRCRLS